MQGSTRRLVAVLSHIASTNADADASADGCIQEFHIYLCETNNAEDIMDAPRIPPQQAREPLDIQKSLLSPPRASI
jgi:hypothetical protein